MREEMADGWRHHETVGTKTVGCLYSGGLDSAFALAHLTREQQANVVLVTYGFAGDHSEDIEAARLSLPAETCRTQWNQVLFSPEAVPATLDAIIQETQLPVDHPNFLAVRGV